MARFFPISIVFCVILCIALFFIRASDVISFNYPIHVITSGWEQESLLAIWNFKAGAAVYVSRFEVPFRWAIYNWLYYASYGTAVTAASDLFSLADAWLPTITRLLTLAGVVFAAVVSYLSFRVLLAPWEPPVRSLAFGFAALVAVGPLVGFWGITTRPDVWAMALEILGILAFAGLYRRNRLVSVVVFCVIAYAAWGFKQANVTAVGAVGLLLLVRRDWASLTVLVLTMVLAWGGTLAVGSEKYVRSILLMEYEPVNTMQEAVKNFVNFATKFIPGLVIGLVSMVVIASSRTLRRAARELWWKEDPALLSIGGLLISTLMVLPSSMHQGAAENYYFTLSYFLSLFALWGLRKALSEGRIASVLLGIGAAGWVLQGVAVALVLAGFAGVLSVRSTHDMLVENKRCLDSLPRPVFVDDAYLSLPWMTPGSLPFVLAYGYDEDRNADRPFERGGVGGMIEGGFFAALALPRGTLSTFDGGSLAAYERIEHPCPTFDVFLRKARISKKTGNSPSFQHE
jgi:hypothetical protein